MYEYISEGMLSRDSCLTFFSLGMCTQGGRYALCRNESSPLTGAVPCAPLRSPDPGTSWQTPGRTCPREQLITSCENQDSVVKGTGRQLGCAVLCPVAPPCPTLRDPMDFSLPSLGQVCGTSQARILEWVAISFSWGSFPPRDGTCISYVSCICRWVLYH